MLSYLEYHRIIIAATIAMARIGGAFLVCPVFTDAMIPGVARRAAMVALAFVTFPMVHRAMPPGELSMWIVVLIAIKEVLIGFLIGFFSAIPFWIAENIGNFIDNQRGATMGEVFSPMNGSQVSSTGLFFSQIVATLFFVSGAIFIFLAAIYASFAIWPVFSASFVSFSPDAPSMVLGTADNLIRTTLLTSAPVVIIMFLATLGLGFVNRTAPQLNVFFLSMPVKSALGLLFMIIYLPFILDSLMYTDIHAILEPVSKVLK